MCCISYKFFYTDDDKQRIAEKKENTKQGRVRTKAGKNLPKGRKTKGAKATKATKENLTASFRVFKDLFTTTMNALKNLLPAKK
jgi:hypothetical protein